jgi:EF hand
MGPAATTALGILVGLILFLGMAVTGVIAVNGASNPGIPSAQPSAAAGGTAEVEMPERKPGSLNALDVNGDGRLSLAEVAGNAEIVTRFGRADRDKDGRLTQAEFDRLAKLTPPKTRKSKLTPRETIRRDAAAAERGG